MIHFVRGAPPLAIVCLLAGNATAQENGYIGVQIKKGETGIEIMVVQDDSPAAKAGLMPNDVIRKIDGKDVEDLAGFVNIIKDTKPGTKLTLGIHRAGKDLDIKITVEKRPES